MAKKNKPSGNNKQGTGFAPFGTNRKPAPPTTPQPKTPQRGGGSLQISGAPAVNDVMRAVATPMEKLYAESMRPEEALERVALARLSMESVLARVRAGQHVGRLLGADAIKNREDAQMVSETLSAYHEALGECEVVTWSAETFNRAVYELEAVFGPMAEGDRIEANDAALQLVLGMKPQVWTVGPREGGFHLPTEMLREMGLSEWHSTVLIGLFPMGAEVIVNTVPFRRRVILMAVLHFVNTRDRDDKPIRLLPIMLEPHGKDRSMLGLGPYLLSALNFLQGTVERKQRVPLPPKARRRLERNRTLKANILPVNTVVMRALAPKEKKPQQGGGSSSPSPEGGEDAEGGKKWSYKGSFPVKGTTRKIRDKATGEVVKEVPVIGYTKCKNLPPLIKVKKAVR
jgi:hypothetical protein